MQYRQWASVVAGIFLGLIFLVAGLGKLPSQADAYIIILNLPRALLTPTLANYIEIWLPRLELTLGLLLIIGIAAKPVAIFTSAIIAAFIFNNSWLISEGLAQEPCGCFQGFTNSFLGFISTEQALYMDIGMLFLALVILFCSPGDWLTVRPWFLRKK